MTESGAVLRATDGDTKSVVDIALCNATLAIMTSDIVTRLELERGAVRLDAVDAMPGQTLDGAARSAEAAGVHAAMSSAIRALRVT